MQSLSGVLLDLASRGGEGRKAASGTQVGKSLGLRNNQMLADFPTFGDPSD